MNKKKKLVEQCKEMVEEVTRRDTALIEELRRLQRDNDTKIDHEKKAFKANYDEHVQQAITAKSRECIEFTAKALAPEFARLKANHEREMMELEQRIKRQGRDLRDAADHETHETLEALEIDASQATATELTQLRDDAKQELQVLEREHRRRLSSAQENSRNELRQLQQSLSQASLSPRIR